MKNSIMKTFVNSIAFGICYALITLIFDHKLDLYQIMISTIFYFIFTIILNCIAPKIKKITGHDKK